MSAIERKLIVVHDVSSPPHHNQKSSAGVTSSGRRLWCDDSVSAQGLLLWNHTVGAVSVRQVNVGWSIYRLLMFCDGCCFSPLRLLRELMQQSNEEFPCSAAIYLARSLLVDLISYLNQSNSRSIRC